MLLSLLLLPLVISLCAGASPKCSPSTIEEALNFTFAIKGGAPRCRDVADACMNRTDKDSCFGQLVLLAATSDACSKAATSNKILSVLWEIAFDVVAEMLKVQCAPTSDALCQADSVLQDAFHALLACAMAGGNGCANNCTTALERYKSC